MDGRTRAFVQVQNGCDHRCTFCIIPFGRGPSRSVPMGVVVEQIKKARRQRLSRSGADRRRHHLLWPDLPGSPTLGKLVQAILRHVPDLPRLRISSIDSIEADDALYEAVERAPADAASASQPAIGRRHDPQAHEAPAFSRADACSDIVAKLRGLRPDMVFGADIITGFPTETDAMFANTLAYRRRGRI